MNEVTKFMWYMYNKWTRDEAVNLFGEDLGLHIWNKYLEIYDTTADYNLAWYSELDNECRQTIVNRANEIYS